MVANLAPKMLDEDFRAGFKVEHQLKDLRYALATANNAGVSLPGTTLTGRLFEDLTNRGLGGEGTQALIKAVQNPGTP
jgi:3-hydroxyisobutyrate dehydrogenase